MLTNSPMPPDILLLNGKMATMDPAIPHATALAVTGERIVWVGEPGEARDWIGPNTNVIDLKGAFVCPGLIDSHLHIVFSDIYRKALQLQGMRSKKELLDAVKEYEKDKPKDSWLFGVGWDDHFWPDEGALHATDLDQVAPDHPLVLQRFDTHLYWVNSKALQVAGIDSSTVSPQGGVIFKDSSGNPNGILLDNAAKLVKEKMPLLTIDDLVQHTLSFLHDCQQHGLTMVHNAAPFQSDFKAFILLASQNALPVRIYGMGQLTSEMLEQGPKSYGPFLDLRCLKLFVDGSFGSSGAALIEPYQNEPNNRGLLLWNHQELRKALIEAKKKGYQVAAHAIGDRAAREILDVYEEVGVKGLRWRVEHAQQLSEEDIGRFAELQVIAAMQPLHATYDMQWLHHRIGEERIRTGSFMLRSLLDSGAVIAGGSDAPVVDINPYWGMYAAITRQDAEGKPEGGWYPDQRVTRIEALQMYTSHAAYSCFREHELGSLTPGKLADILVCDTNLLTCHPKELLKAKPLFTIVNGKIGESFLS